MTEFAEKAIVVAIDNSSYSDLPAVPVGLIDRQFALADGNVEITSLDIAPHGAFVAAGTSSGMILLFDLSNPNEQRDGMLIGQIRARGMHTNLILTVKFSEDGRFVFAGVSKGSSEMLAIDLGRVLVDWDTDANPSSRSSSELVQQQQLKNLITFNFSDAKLRGFSAVARIERPAGTGSTSSCSSLRSSARYRLACGKGIKNVHIWHFTAGYLPQDDGVDARERPLHGKWEYVCDVASNGNTITHIEFRRGGQELLSKSAGMCVRLWELNASEVPPRAEAVASPEEGCASGDAAGSSTDVDDAPPPALAAAGASGFSLKPTYCDIANSQDIKCLLPIGTVAYGGTYQFAVLNTGAPKEANRDVLELPERFSGDSLAAGAPSAAMSVGRGRRITREIEQVVCTDGGQHALVMCADGGVVFYGAAGAEDEGRDADELAAAEGPAEGPGCGGFLVELPSLSRQKDQQQHPGSWTLRRIGRQGHVVLLRALFDVVSQGVVVECRMLAGLLPSETPRSLLDSFSATSGERFASSGYYVDSSFHAEQLEARRLWRRSGGAATKRGAEGNGKAAVAKKVKLTSKVALLEGDAALDDDAAAAAAAALPAPSSASRKRKAPSAFSDKSPAGVADLLTGAALVTPAATQANARHNKISPYEDAAARLASYPEGGEPPGLSSPVVASAAPYGSRSAGRSSRQVSASTSFAKLRALRDDDAGEEVPVAAAQSTRTAPVNVPLRYSALEIGPAPKVRRLSIVATVHPVVTAMPHSGGLAAVEAVRRAVADWLTSSGRAEERAFFGCGAKTLGACAMQRLGVIAAEQDRLRDQFVREVSGALVAHAGTCGGDAVKLHGGAVLPALTLYTALAAELTTRQQLELQGACAADVIVGKGLLTHEGEVRVDFRHQHLLSGAHSLSPAVLDQLRA